jgi:hypothetical protein
MSSMAAWDENECTWSWPLVLGLGGSGVKLPFAEVGSSTLRTLVFERDGTNVRVFTLSGVGGSIASSNAGMLVEADGLGACLILLPSVGKGLIEVDVSSKSDLAEAAALDNDCIEFSADLRKT